MKQLFTTTALAAFFVTPAFAGSPSAFVIEDPAVVAITSEATDWSGPYIGATVSLGSGTYIYDSSGKMRIEDLLDTTQFGAFAGYSFQRGNLVFGVEAAYTTGRMEWDSDTYYAYDWIADLKGRVGYAMGDALIYAVAGGSWAGYDYDTHPETHSGFNYGVGVDFHVTDGMFVGLEYLQRDVSLEVGQNTTRGGNIQSISARVGLSF